MVLGSNDHERPLTDLAQLLLLRWGQENFFKRRNINGTLDHMPGYDFEVTPDDPLVDNPQIETLRKEKSHLQARLERLQGQLGANLLERKRDTIELAQYKAQHDQLIQDIATLEHQVEALKLQLKALPKQVPISQVLGQPLEQANSERKTFLDTLAILADQAESSLLDMLAQVDPGRDHRIVLHTILHHGAVVQLIGSILQVRLKPFDSPRLQRLAETVCVALTAQKAHTLDKFSFLVVYQVTPGTL
jgi:chaperonin cofactor prefoldin